MPEVVLDRARVLAVIRQLVAGREGSHTAALGKMSPGLLVKMSPVG